MPPRKNIQDGMTDTWGRRNRTLANRECLFCHKIFRPARSTSTYCSVPCARTKNGGHNKKSESWWVNSKGYVEGRLWQDGKQIRVKQHRHIASAALGRPLLPTEDVHHENEQKIDNDPTNFVILNHGAHTSLHNRSRIYKRGYKLNLTDDERRARSERMHNMRRAALKKAEGQS